MYKYFNFTPTIHLFKATQLHRFYKINIKLSKLEKLEFHKNTVLRLQCKITFENANIIISNKNKNVYSYIQIIK